MVATLVLCSLVSGVLESAILVLVAQVAAAMVDGRSRLAFGVGPVEVVDEIGPVLAIALAVGVLRLGLQVVVAYLPARIGADMQADLRTELHEAFGRASWSLQSDEREGDLQELLTGQTVEATQGLMQTSAFLVAGASFLALLVTAVLLSLPVAVTVLATAWLLSFALRPMTRRGRGYGRRLSAAFLAYAGGVSRTVTLAEENQVFGVIEADHRRVGGLVEDARAAFFRNAFVARLVPNVYQGMAIVVIVGGLAVLHWSGTGRIAILGAVVLILVRSTNYAQQAHTASLLVRQALPFVERLLAAEERYRAAAVPAGPRPFAHVRSLAFEGVGFAYPRKQPVLADVSFALEGGQAVGIVGPSGAGKSTLVQLLLRLREPQAGAYIVNGHPSSELSRDDWRRKVAYVPQDPKLMHGTVADNIRFLRDLDDVAVKRAARLAHIDDDVMSWPGGYQATIGQRSDAVSGGQRQRICLARALAAEPSFLILDEPTSALDMRSEELIQESLTGLHGWLTLVVVSHRVSTLSVCDRVLVMAGGRVEAFGSLAQVERSNPFFRGAVALTGRAMT